MSNSLFILSVNGSIRPLDVNYTPKTSTGSLQEHIPFEGFGDSFLLENAECSWSYTLSTFFQTALNANMSSIWAPNWHRPMCRCICGVSPNRVQVRVICQKLLSDCHHNCHWVRPSHWHNPIAMPHKFPVNLYWWQPNLSLNCFGSSIWW